MTKTSKQSGTSAKRRPQVSDKTALSEAQLEAARGGDGSSPTLLSACSTGPHFSK